MFIFLDPLDSNGGFALYLPVAMVNPSIDSDGDGFLSLLMYLLELTLITFLELKSQLLTSGLINSFKQNIDYSQADMVFDLARPRPSVFPP